MNTNIQGDFQICISVPLIKTNQLLTVFQSTKRIKRKYFAKASEVAVPGIFIAANALLNIIHLVNTTFKFGVFEKKTEHLRLKYCQMTSFFYIDLITVILVSITFSIKAFSGMRLPSSYNEMKFIFLATFTLTIHMSLSVILHANFQNKGIVIFVESLMVFFCQLECFQYNVWIQSIYRIVS